MAKPNSVNLCKFMGENYLVTKAVSMKVLPFTIPVSHDRTVIVKEEVLPFFYPHLHQHEEIQLTLIQKGEGTLLVGSSMHSFKAGELYLIGANIPHVFKSSPSYFSAADTGAAHALTLFFSTKGKLSSLFELPELRNVHSFFAQHCSGFRVPPQAVNDIAGKMLSIQYDNGLEQLMQFFQLLKMLSALENIIPLATDTPSKTYTDYEGMRISSIYSYIMQNYNHGITLEEVAAIAFMTPQAFCRYFKKHTGLTFVSFLNEIRINEACKKLINGSYESVSSVAYDCGFNSITNFNRVFKSTIHKSPREYVSQYLGNMH